MSVSKFNQLCNNDRRPQKLGVDFAKSVDDSARYMSVAVPDFHGGALSISKEALQAAMEKIVEDLSTTAAEPESKYKHPRLQVYLGNVTPDHGMAKYIRIMIDDREIAQTRVLEAQEGEHGYVRFYVTDSRSELLPGPVERVMEGRVHFELVENSGLTESQIHGLTDPRNAVVVSKKLIKERVANDINNSFRKKKRRVQRFEDEDV